MDARTAEDRCWSLTAKWRKERVASTLVELPPLESSLQAASGDGLRPVVMNADGNKAMSSSVGHVCDVAAKVKDKEQKTALRRAPCPLPKVAITLRRDEPWMPEPPTVISLPSTAFSLPCPPCFPWFTSLRLESNSPRRRRGNEACLAVQA